MEPISLADARPEGRVAYRELLRHASMSAGVYLLPRGATDPQRPHAQDELYHVVRGRGKFEQGGRVVDVAPATILFVAKGEPHRFVDIEEDLVVLVVFAPAETTTA